MRLSDDLFLYPLPLTEGKFDFELAKPVPLSPLSETELEALHFPHTTPFSVMRIQDTVKAEGTQVQSEVLLPLSFLPSPPFPPLPSPAIRGPTNGSLKCTWR